MAKGSSNSEKIEKYWQTLESVPFGKRLFSGLVSFFNPYAGSIHASIEKLSTGYCKASFGEARRIKNPYNSIHAVALTNLGELTAGLAFNHGLPTSYRAIPVNLNISFLKKARGKITCECQTSHPSKEEDHDFVTHAEMKDRAGDIVAKLEVTWRVSLRTK